MANINIEEFAREIARKGMSEDSLIEYPMMGKVLISLMEREEIQYIKDMKDLFNKSNVIFQILYDLCSDETEMKAFMFLWTIALEGGAYEK